MNNTPDSGNASLTTFLVNELRDMRRTQENSVSALGTKIGELTQGMMALATKFDSSHATLQEVREDVSSLTTRVGDIETMRGKEQVAKSSAWSGPKRVGLIIAGAGSAAAGLMALKTLWPALLLL